MKKLMKDLKLINGIEEIAKKEYQSRTELFNDIKALNEAIKIDMRTCEIVIDNNYYIVGLKRKNKKYKINIIMGEDNITETIDENGKKCIHHEATTYKLEW